METRVAQQRETTVAYNRGSDKGWLGKEDMYGEAWHGWGSVCVCVWTRAKLSRGMVRGVCESVKQKEKNQEKTKAKAWIVRSGCLLGAFHWRIFGHPTGRRPRGRPGTNRRDYISRYVYLWPWNTLGSPRRNLLNLLPLQQKLMMQLWMMTLMPSLSCYVQELNDDVK